MQRSIVAGTLFALLAVALVASLMIAPRGSGASRPATTAAAVVPASVVTATILQINDVYEIMPVGDFGGLARLATLRRQLAAENPNTYMVLAGDLFSPSALGTAKAGPGGSALNGRQIVDGMNRAGLNYATFGNHEFDLGKADFEQRLKESVFTWVSANVNAGGTTQPLPGVPRHVVITATNPSGRALRIGLFGLTINSNVRDYVAYSDPFDAASREIAALNGDSDIVVALTHLEFEDDEKLAEAHPELAMILGGHEHLNVLARRGVGLVPIAKADANAKSVYIHRLRYDTAARKLTVDSEWKAIDASIPDDPAVKAEVERWRDAAFAAFRTAGFEPDKVVTTLTEPLDGREEAVRTGPAPLARLIADAMREAFPGSDAAIFNSGSIRIDDTLPPGPMTQYDVLRVLPFGGNVVPVTVPGATLKKIMDAGNGNRNSGGYLQAVGLDSIDERRTYRVVMNDFLLSGREVNLGFIARPESGIKPLPDAPKEFRHVVIERLTRGL